MSTGAFRLPDRNCSGVHTISNTRDNTADDELTDLPATSEADGCEEGADDQSAGTHANEASTAESVTVKHGEHGAEEASELVAGGDSAANNVDVVFLGSASVFGHFEDGEGAHELLSVEETGHHTLVVSEERETHHSGEGDIQPE